MFGNVSRITKDFEDLQAAEKWVLIPLCALVILGGIFPNVVLSFSEATVGQLAELIK
jgi:NADH:ubiquinone oxidoreductase subunit 4 (subunit M)